jgi:hypothetical protein
MDDRDMDTGERGPRAHRTEAPPRRPSLGQVVDLASPEGRRLGLALIRVLRGVPPGAAQPAASEPDAVG